MKVSNKFNRQPLTKLFIHKQNVMFAGLGLKGGNKLRNQAVKVV